MSEKRRIINGLEIPDWVEILEEEDEELELREEHNPKRRIINGLEIPDWVEIIEEEDIKQCLGLQNTRKFYPDTEEISLISPKGEKFHTLALIDSGSSLFPFLDLQTALSMGYKISYVQSRTIFLAGVALQSYLSNATIVFRGIKMPTQIYAVRDLKNSIKFPVLLSKPFLHDYTRKVGTEGKILLNFNDDNPLRSK